MTLSLATSSDTGTSHSVAAASSSRSRASARPTAGNSGPRAPSRSSWWPDGDRRRCCCSGPALWAPRHRQDRIFPHLAPKSSTPAPSHGRYGWPTHTPRGTFVQSHCSSSATIIGQLVNTPCPISFWPTRIVTVSSGAIVIQALISGTMASWYKARPRNLPPPRPVRPRCHTQATRTPAPSRRRRQRSCSRIDGDPFRSRSRALCASFACRSCYSWSVISPTRSACPPRGESPGGRTVLGKPSVLPHAQCQDGARPSRMSALLRPAQIMVLERQVSKPLAGDREYGIADRRRHLRNGFLARAVQPPVGLEKTDTDLAWVLVHP